MKKKFSDKRPVMFYQEGNNKNSFSLGERLRIVYPDGKVEWCSLVDFGSGESAAISTVKYAFNRAPCYCWDGDFKDMKSAIARIDEYDKNMGFEPMEIMGEL